MNNMTRYVKIGLFFLSLGIAGTSYVVVSGDGFNGWNTKLYEVALQDASGLSTNSKVYLAGVPVGKIRQIDLEGDTALLRIAFLKDVVLRADSVITRQPSSLLGTSVLSLSPGTELTPIVEEGSRIRSAPSAGDYRTALTEATNIGKQVSVLIAEFQSRQLELLTVSLETFNAIARKVEERSDAELDRVSRVLESSALIAERMEALLRDRQGDVDASAADIRAALENIRAITEEVRSGRGNVGKSLYGEELYDSIMVTAAKAEEAAARLNSVLEGAERFANTADGAAANADKVIAQAGALVQKATGLGVQVDSGARWDLVGATGRAAASLRLEPAKGDRWYRIGIASTVEDTEPAYGTAFDVELARRFGPLTLRGGMLESSAGMGLDLSPLPWLTLSAEAFGFSAGLPNVRSTVTILPFFDPYSDKPWNWLYFRGGVTNALDGKRDFFLGGGLRFADEEVRGLIGLVPLLGN